MDDNGCFYKKEHVFVVVNAGLEHTPPFTTQQYCSALAMSTTVSPQHHVACREALAYLHTAVADSSVDLVLTDPPYTISRKSGMQHHYEAVQGDTLGKTEAEWTAYAASHPDIKGTAAQKRNFLKYGTIYGKKYAVQTDFGQWDTATEFTKETMQAFVHLMYKKLRKGGTVIIFYDLWKITELKEMLEAAKFKQLRMIEWIKTNPQPINSKRNYLTNCREVAVVAVKCGSCTFHSQYDNGIYKYPLQSGKRRFHPTQKSEALFNDLVTKHSNEGDLVMDPFLGSGTTVRACLATKRRCVGCECNGEYFVKMRAQLEPLVAEAGATVTFLEAEMDTEGQEAETTQTVGASTNGATASKKNDAGVVL